MPRAGGGRRRGHRAVGGSLRDLAAIVAASRRRTSAPRHGGRREGKQYAVWLSTAGAIPFILKSRLKEWGHPAPLQDVLRAIRFVRSRAAEFGVSPQRIGMIGSSAGGHLAAPPRRPHGAALDRSVSAQPDFAVLVYPVITMADPAANAGSRRALLGDAQPGPAGATVSGPAGERRHAAHAAAHAGRHHRAGGHRFRQWD